MPTPWKQAPLNVVRGGLIGTAETIPGVSGGTLALVTGVYTNLIDAAGELLSALRLLFGDLAKGKGTARGRTALRGIDWALVLPVLAGMAVALVLAAKLLAPILENHPEHALGAFGGMILASIIVPLRAMGAAPRGLDYLLMLLAAVACAVLTGLPAGEIADPPLWLVGIVAAFAINALVLPGVSGSFLMLTVGIYGPTIAAVNDRNLAYLGAFALGALIGLGLFVKGLQWLLHHRRQATLAVMTGLMIGSLRALWPWQDEDRTLLAPYGDVGGVVALAVAGAVLVIVLVVAEAKIHARQHAGRENDGATASV
ncbi:DUF368 domain-containing protein [Amycolatopsis aidingensis]|uniref:DUF368 domain-containing protein n=1 Tax=Amycolatopsis aidingensis TaxID=2842453 RepID=UPI001C0C1AC4|nr:DUF368 domain-containing protein [Amycolatopsis aidingensis]